MRFTRRQAMVLVVLLHIVVPGFLIALHAVTHYTSVVEWAALTSLLASYAALIHLVGAWAFASYYVRYGLVLAALAAVLRSLPSVSGLPLTHHVTAPAWVRDGLAVAATLVLSVLAANALRARSFDGETLALSFPFERGVYSVFEGGNGRRSALMNYHYASAVHGRSGVNDSMKYAVDITRLSVWGNDANGFFPRRCGRYPVFNEVVVSPCDGVVAAVHDGRPNEEPWSGRGPYNLGNYVLLRAGGHHVLMGHLQAGSLRVETGTSVEAGDPIALVGNSGWTSQPHLHIQAMRADADSLWQGEGVPVVFDRRSPFKNRLFFR